MPVTDLAAVRVRRIRVLNGVINEYFPGRVAEAEFRTVTRPVMSEKILTAGELLDGHAALDIQCLDRIYLNAYVPILQTSSQVVAFLSGHLGFSEGAVLS